MKEFLQHSLLFDSYRWTDHREMQELYNRMLSEIPQSDFKPKTVESLKSHLRLFLCNLYIAYYYKKPIAISLKAEKFTHGRYHDLHLKRIPFTTIYQYLKEAGWIEYKIGFMPFSHGEDEKDCTGSLTRIWASLKLTAAVSASSSLPGLSRTTSRPDRNSRSSCICCSPAFPSCARSFRCPFSFCIRPAVSARPHTVPA